MTDVRLMRGTDRFERAQNALQVSLFGGRGIQVGSEFVGVARSLTNKSAGLGIRAQTGRLLFLTLHGPRSEQGARARTTFPAKKIVVVKHHRHGQRLLIGSGKEFRERLASRSAFCGQLLVGHTQVAQPLVDEVLHAGRALFGHGDVLGSLGTFFGHGHSREAISGDKNCPHSIWKCRQMLDAMMRAER